MERDKSGAFGWAAVGAVVIAWDLLAPETLTAAFKRAPLAVRLGSLAVLGGHLMGAIPREVDPFYMVLDRTPLRDLHVDKGPTVSD